MKILRPFFSLMLIALAVTAVRAQTSEEPLLGTVEGRTYLSPSGVFRVTIPVLPELGGSISDTENVVTFQDDFNQHISMAAFQQDATQRWEMSTRGLKEYLVYFFKNFVMADFERTFPGSKIESAKFLPAQREGSLLVYSILPGGSMFNHRVASFGVRDTAPTAKRGNLLFVKNGQIFVISMELAERVIEGNSYDKTTAQEDEILRERLLGVAAHIQFLKPDAKR